VKASSTDAGIRRLNSAAVALAALLIAAGLLLSGGCARRPTTVRFPLEVGTEWRYSGAYRSLQAAKAVRITAYDHVLRVDAFENDYYVTNLLIGGSAFGTLLLRWEGGDLCQPAGDGTEVVLKGTLTDGDSWRFTFQGRTVEMRAGRLEEKTVLLGKYQAVRLDFEVKGECAGKLWVADGTGIVAAEYDSRTDGKGTRLELGLSSFGKKSP
jgi:hypothetical protein